MPYTVFYRYVKYDAMLTEAIMAWLYEHSAGIISVVVSLVHDAQEIAILSGKETLNLETLNEAYQKRLSLLHGFIEPTISSKSYVATKMPKVPTTEVIVENTVNPHLILELATMAKNEQLDIVSLLREHMTIVEVSV